MFGMDVDVEGKNFHLPGEVRSPRDVATLEAPTGDVEMGTPLVSLRLSVDMEAVEVDRMDDVGLEPSTTPLASVAASMVRTPSRPASRRAGKVDSIQSSPSCKSVHSSPTSADLGVTSSCGFIDVRVQALVVRCWTRCWPGTWTDGNINMTSSNGCFLRTRKPNSAPALLC